MNKSGVNKKLPWHDILPLDLSPSGTREIPGDVVAVQYVVNSGEAASLSIDAHKMRSFFERREIYA